MKQGPLVSRALIGAIHMYQRYLSLDQGWLGTIIPHRGRTCAFYPSCSEYAAIAIEKYGAFRGIPKALRRIIRCHPWQQPQVDFP